MRISRNAAGNVLALDLASTTGWCMGPLGARPRHGAISLRGLEHVHRQAALRDWIEDQEKVAGRFTAIVVEAAIIGAFSSQEAERLTVALHGMVELWAYDAEIPFMAVAASTARKAILGKGSFPKGEVKGEVVRWCRGAGFTPKTDDDADAILLWHAVADATLGRL